MANGPNKYTVQESNNLQLGQAGFDVFINGATPSNETGTWVALQALGVSANALVTVHAEVAIGENTKVEIVRSTGVQGLLKTQEPKK